MSSIKVNMLLGRIFLIIIITNPIVCVLNLYNTELIRLSENFQWNCLSFSTRLEWDSTLEVEYCFRPPNDGRNGFEKGFLGEEHQRFTFDQLLRLNITTAELRSWSIPFDLIEEYQEFLYHQENRFASKEIVRCDGLWFGSNCEYSFNISQKQDFRVIVQQIIQRKLKTKPLENENFETCYSYLHCTDQGIPICLHWAQICDGRIDCIDNEEDESLCFQMEINECEANQYRCHNGQCIDESFSQNDMIECLDQSDYIPESSAGNLITAINFIWAEYRCPLGTAKFVCGVNENCIRDLYQCNIGQHRNFIRSISMQNTLKTDCWKSLLCLTKLVSQVDQNSCEQYIGSINLTNSISTCDPLIFFPTKPVLLHHVRFIYIPDYLIVKQTSQAAIPAYICYNHHLCEHLQPTFHHLNFTCRHSSLMGLNTSSVHSTWISIIDTIRPFFHGCMLPWQKMNQSNLHPSLYCCRNSSKCISQHRLIDGIIDCSYHDDEHAIERSCSILHSHRFRCHDEQQCRSPLFSRSVCPPRPYRELKELRFHEICDRILQTAVEVIDGKNHTDETECNEWPCSNVYTRCDNFWNCPNGEDEANCSSLSLAFVCPPSTFQCVDIANYSIICLPKEKVEDGVIDCLGGADEQSFCRFDVDWTFRYAGFRCFNDTKCLFMKLLCDGYSDCRFGDDELFCDERRHICADHLVPFQTDSDKLICHLGFAKRSPLFHEILPTHPLFTNASVQVSSTRTIRSTMADIFHPWYCHEGLPVQIRLARNQYGIRCLCPPTFFGDRCEHQSQRISVTLKVYPVRKRGVQSFLISLISDDSQLIHSYHRSSYVLEESCGKTFKFFLLFSSRPKNLSTNYFIKIDAFNQTTSKYLASWRYRVPFTFLPVNPMTIVIRVPAESIISSDKCRLMCGNHGRCMKYLNEESFFCRCDVGWTGTFCDQLMNCDDCAADSLCVGSHENRSICLCPINTFGRRCLLKYVCEKGVCDNNGQCLVTDDSESQESFACLCPDRFHGIYCHIEKSVLHLSFQDMAIPTYISVNVLHSNVKELGMEKHTFKLYVQKLRMFQKSVTLYIDDPFQIVIVRANEKYYLAVLEPSLEIRNITTTISPAQQCLSFGEIAARHLTALQAIRRVKYYHQMCQINSQIMCFTDQSYLCLCTLERHAHCLTFEVNFTCQEDLHCQNGAQCFQDNSKCPSNTFCICSDCFYGDRCQFYSKGIGSTLDDMLRYELRPSVDLSHQPISVKVSGGISLTMFVIGATNGILSLMTFYTSASRQVGAGLYLLASSVTSVLTVTFLNVKFWFLIITHTKLSTPHSLLRAGCIGLEPVLKLVLYTDSWLNACVAIERAITVFKGVNFNRLRSKVVARWMIGILPLLILASLTHEFINRDLSEDEEEKRFWCVFEYSNPMIAYNTFILSVHISGPFLANLLSTISIISSGARRKAQVLHRGTYLSHIRKQLKEHRQLIISPLILTILSLPRVIISLIPDCIKADRNPWIYLSSYFISFIPSMTVFLVFVVPSPLYRNEFRKSTRILKRRISKMTAFRAK